MIVGVGMFTQAEKSAVPWETAEYSVRPAGEGATEATINNRVYRWTLESTTMERGDRGSRSSRRRPHERDTKLSGVPQPPERRGTRTKTLPPPRKRDTRCRGARKSTAAEDLALLLSESCQDVATWKEGDKE